MKSMATSGLAPSESRAAAVASLSGSSYCGFVDRAEAQQIPVELTDDRTLRPVIRPRITDKTPHNSDLRKRMPTRGERSPRELSIELRMPRSHLLDRECAAGPLAARLA